jgi:hypothetical protein
MTDQNNKTNSITDCNAVDQYKRIKICFRCLHKFGSKTSLKVGDDCPVPGCPGHIIFLEKELEPIFVALRKKNYLPTMLSSGEFCSHGFVLRLNPFQCLEHLPALPTDFRPFHDRGAILLERKYNSTDPVKRRAEVEGAIKDVEKWVETLPVILTLKSVLNFSSKDLAEELNNDLQPIDEFYDSKVVDHGNGVYAVEAFRIIKEDKGNEEISNIPVAFKDYAPDSIYYKLLN